MVCDVTSTLQGTYTVDVVGGGRKAADMVHKSHNDMEQFAILNV